MSNLDKTENTNFKSLHETKIFKDSKLKEIIVLMSIPPIITILPLVIAIYQNPPDTNTPYHTIFLIPLYSIFLEVILLCYFLVYGIPKVKFILTNKIFAVVLKDKLFFHILWKDIEKIQISKDSIPPQGFETERRIGYKLIFIGPNIGGTLRLWSLPIRAKNKSYFLNSFKEYFIKMNKEIIEFEHADLLSQSDYIKIVSKYLLHKTIISKKYTSKYRYILNLMNKNKILKRLFLKFKNLFK